MKARIAYLIPLALLVSCQQEESPTGAGPAGTTTIAARVERTGSVTDAIYQSASTVTVRLQAGSYDRTQSHPFGDRGCDFEGVPIGAAYTMTFTGLDGSNTAIWSGTNSGTTASSGTTGSTSASVVTVSIKPITYGNLTDSRDGRAYRTVTIGDQTWMAQNLNYAGAGSCYSSNADSCSKYGRSYTWTEAMGVSSNYSTKSLGMSLPRQGACPDGWHIPGQDEWTTLETTVGRLTAGTQFKSTTGWAGSGNGTDAYGFQVLPFGYRRSDGTFDLDRDASYWTASEYDTSIAWAVFLVYNDSETHHNHLNTKSFGFSLRCLKGAGAVDTVETPILNPDGGTYTSTQTVTITSATSGATVYYTINGTAPTASSTPYTGPIAVSASKTLRAIAVKPGMANSPVASATYTINSSTSIPWKAGITYGSLTDSRDNHVYKTVKIGTQNWMAENLNYAGAGVCYNSSADSCTKYGRLYSWTEAMGASSTYNTTSLNATPPRQGICPNGWHVPSDAEWSTLVRYSDSATSGTKLKSSSGWSNSGNGTDDYGFRVLPAGGSNSSGAFGNATGAALFWSASELDTSDSWTRAFIYSGAAVYRNSYFKPNSFSLRCLDNASTPGTSIPSAGMRLIPAGTFTMGSPETETNRANNEPQHSVMLSSFYMDTTDVTQGQYQTLMGTNPSYFSSCGSTCPVEAVTWFDAVLYCNARSKQAGLDTVYSYTGLTDTGNGTSNLTGLTATLSKNGYRLPTEAQWEYAARGGTTTAFYWGNDTSAAIVGRYAWDSANASGATHPVASKLPNGYGLYDMAGNVWQWTNDWWGSYPTTVAAEPSGPSSGTYRVERGGSWNAIAPDLRSANRGGIIPSDRYGDIGFRCVRPGP